jgi:methylglutaconyl-CoA hydratase
MTQFVNSTFADGVGRIVLDRPEKRNALTRAFIEQLLAAVETLRANDELRLLVLSSTGPVFCAGMDLGEMRERAASDQPQEEWSEDSRILTELFSTLYQLPVPTLAVVQGPAIAGGMGLVLACDLVLASEQAVFALPEPVRGITAAIVTPLLIHRVGMGPATQLLLSGTRWSADRAMTAGLCLDVAIADNLATRATQAEKDILQGAQSALAITKRHIATCAGEMGADELVAKLKASTTISAEARQTADAQEGLDAFLEKRKPNWQV